MRRLFVPTFIFSILISGVNSYAQKLPNIQTLSVPAPANIKIDGKATEWNNKFQAFNHAVLFYYTLANDENNLYLVVQATNPDVVKHILNGGITLAVSVTGDKKDKNMPSITFPVSGPGNKVIILSQTKPDPTTMPAQADSFMRAKNAEMGIKFKTIKTKNISQLDTTISVYNTDNIKTAGLLDINLIYTCEIAIPLKYLKIDEASKFAYHITINDVKESGVSTTMDSSGQHITAIRVNIKTYAKGQDATDFWGECTLAH